MKLNWSGDYRPPAPHFTGARHIGEVPISSLWYTISWTPFFSVWELTGKFPAILDDPKVGEAARGLYADAQEMLRQIIAERWFQAHAVIGFWPTLTRATTFFIC